MLKNFFKNWQFIKLRDSLRTNGTVLFQNIPFFEIIIIFFEDKYD
jgi:hypothetical protein